VIDRALRIFVVAGEESGDQLGAELMEALSRRRPSLHFQGVGGERMARRGLRSLFPLRDITAIGIAEVVTALPRLLARIRQTADAVVAARPDILVIIDSPDFTHRVARRVRRQAPDIPIVDYVCPSVWAWRPWRAKAMTRYVDRVMAILPFEPEALRRLGGPPCDYVGHPLIERLDRLRPGPGERTPMAEAGRPVLLVLPGSRRGEVRRLLPSFGETIAAVLARRGPVDLVLPAVPHLVNEIEAATRDWPARPSVVVGEDAKFTAFRRAHAALAASGTVTLELALAGVPQVVAYRLDRLARALKWMIKVPSIVLANLVLGDRTVPEFIDDEATPERLAAALGPLLRDSPERARQAAAFSRLDGLMQLDRGAPSDRAAEIVLMVAERTSA
jgi:lipid-A-disaccharide synthase